MTVISMRMAKTKSTIHCQGFIMNSPTPISSWGGMTELKFSLFFGLAGFDLVRISVTRITSTESKTVLPSSKLAAKRSTPSLYHKRTDDSGASMWMPAWAKNSTG